MCDAFSTFLKYTVVTLIPLLFLTCALFLSLELGYLWQAITEATARQVRNIGLRKPFPWSDENKMAANGSSTTANANQARTWDANKDIFL